MASAELNCSLKQGPKSQPLLFSNSSHWPERFPWLFTFSKLGLADEQTDRHMVFSLGSPVQEDSEPVISQNDFHDQRGADTMNLLEVVIAVEQGQASDEGHHHQLHQGPGRRLGARARAHWSLVTGVLLIIIRWALRSLVRVPINNKSNPKKFIRYFTNFLSV